MSLQSAYDEFLDVREHDPKEVKISKRLLGCGGFGIVGIIVMFVFWLVWTLIALMTGHHILSFFITLVLFAVATAMFVAWAVVDSHENPR